MTDTVVAPRTGAEDIVWDLSVFYAGVDDPAIQHDMDGALQRADALTARIRGRVAALSAAEIADVLREIEAITDLYGRLITFASLNFSTDTNSEVFGALYQRVLEFSADLEQRLLPFSLEWKALDDAAAARVLNDPAIGRYRHYLEADRHYRPHTLSEAEEALLIEKNVTGRAAWERLFEQIHGAARYDLDGERLTLAQVLANLHSPDRDLRRRSADVVAAGMQARSMELTYIFNVLTADKAAEDRRRKYPNWISSRNLSNKASDAAVEALIQAVTARYDLVARHYSLKRKLLGFDTLYEYDRYAPLPLEESTDLYTWDQARDIVLNAFEQFTPRLREIAERFFTERWIHAPVQPGKNGGAFCSPSVPSAHPFVLLNYTGRARDVATLAHELGHGAHAVLAGQAQGILYIDPPLTTAEMASVFGEMLVFTDLMAKEPNPAAQLAMLAARIEDSMATIFRQVALNRFEDGLHTARRTEGELPAARINALWMQTQNAMFQGSVTLRDEYSTWWSYIPHFVGAPGYVYAYAFGELLVLALFNLYRRSGADFAPAYLDVLAAGNSDYPHHILARLGIDLNDPAFWNTGLDALAALVDEEERLARQVYPDKLA